MRPSRRSAAAHLAIQVHGAYGYSAEYGIERYFRNARAPIIYEGTTQIHKLMQAEHALGYRRLNGDGDVSPMAAWAPALAQSSLARGGPLPVARFEAEAGADRVLKRRIDCGFEVPLVLDRERGEALVEEVPAAAVTLVETARVDRR